MVYASAFVHVYPGTPSSTVPIPTWWCWSFWKGRLEVNYNTTTLLLRMWNQGSSCVDSFFSSIPWSPSPRALSRSRRWIWIVERGRASNAARCHEQQTEAMSSWIGNGGPAREHCSSYKWWSLLYGFFFLFQKHIWCNPCSREWRSGHSWDDSQNVRVIGLRDMARTETAERRTCIQRVGFAAKTSRKIGQIEQELQERQQWQGENTAGGGLAKLEIARTFDNRASWLLALFFFFNFCLQKVWVNSLIMILIEICHMICLSIGAGAKNQNTYVRRIHNHSGKLVQ